MDQMTNEEKVSFVRDIFIQKYELPMGPDINKETWRVEALPHLQLWICSESEIDLLINKLLEIRKQYTDAKNNL